jgi:hypothetical protein
LEKYKISQNELKKKLSFARNARNESEGKKIVTAKKGEREKKFGYKENGHQMPNMVPSLFVKKYFSRMQFSQLHRELPNTVMILSV